MLSNEVFETTYEPVEGPQGAAYWELDEIEAAGIPHNRVWTVVEGEGAWLYALPGLHYVNRLYYIVTEQPWTDPDLGAVWFNPED